VVHAISKCDEDARPWLYRNIVLTGGNASFLNFAERMETEIRKLAPEHFDVSQTYLSCTFYVKYFFY
jgi:actin-related protein